MKEREGSASGVSAYCGQAILPRDNVITEGTEDSNVP